MKIKMKKIIGNRRNSVFCFIRYKNTILSKPKTSNSAPGFIRCKNTILSKPKTSQGHIEMILSMILFVGALIFIFVFINPFSRVGEGISVIGDVEDGIIGNISMDVGKLSAVENVGGVTCATITATYGANYKEVIGANKIDFYFADFFSGGGCSTTYTLGSFTNEKIIINDSIGKLKTAYNNDYTSLKESLNLLNDFAFIVKDINGVEIAGLTPNIKKSPAGVDVESKDIPIRVLNDDGTFEELILNIRAW